MINRYFVIFLKVKVLFYKDFLLFYCFKYNKCVVKKKHLNIRSHSFYHKTKAALNLVEG